MDLKEFFIKVVHLLQKEKVGYALAGGLVASLYRDQERVTKDLDFLILSQSHTHKKATEIVLSFGLQPNIICKADLEGGPLFAIKKMNTQPYMIVGRTKDDSSKIGLDFILPEMPWFESAFTRAEHHLIDFGFGKIPCLTVEDVIISKFFSLKNDPTRFNDLDDLKSIFRAQHTLDLAYLSGQMQKLNLEVPKLLKEMVPKALSLVSTKIGRPIGRN